MCRPEVDARSLVARLEALGASAIVLPLFERVGADDDGAALRSALDDLGSYDWIAFTSVNGVRAVVEAMDSTRFPETLRVAAVGRATAEALTGAGIGVDLVPLKATAADLAAAFEPTERGSRVLAPLADRASSDLVEGLRALGYEPHRVEAYRMQRRQVDETSLTDADAVLLTSPSIVEQFLAVTSAAAPVPPIVVCIGPRTSAAAERLGLDGSTIAEPHDEVGLVEALITAVDDRPGCRGVDPPT